jgi:hypothetical protein
LKSSGFWLLRERSKVKFSISRWLSRSEMAAFYRLKLGSKTLRGD